jgi:hypothetical protein
MGRTRKEIPYRVISAKNVRLEPVKMGATQLDVSLSEGAGVGAATEPVTRL